MREKYFEWVLKIPRKDNLRMEKREAIEVAIELCYPDTVLEQIVCAATELRINNVLSNARSRM